MAGHQLYLGTPRIGEQELRRFEDWMARVALSSNGNGHAGNVGVTVRADESALLELVEGGVIHPSLVRGARSRLDRPVSAGRGRGLLSRRRPPAAHWLPPHRSHQ